MKAIIIARVSTEEQKEAGNSLPAQQKRLLDYVDRNENLELHKEFIFDESAYKADNRKKFDEVLKYLESFDEVVALCADKIDRLTRDFLIGLPTIERLRRYGKIEVHCPSDNLIIHKDSPATDLFHYNMAVSLSQYYSNSISDNVKRAREQILASGRWPGKAYYGYKNILREDGTKDIVEDNFESLIVKKIYEWYATGACSMITIKQRLKKDYDISFHKSYIDSILKNKFYMGLMFTKGKLYPHIYKPLITKDLFDQVQNIKKSHAKVRFKYAGLPYFYRGLIRCADCGCMVSPEMKKGKYVYYHCTQYKGKHNAPYVSEQEITRQFSDLYKSIRVPEHVVDEIIGTLKATHEGKIELRKAHLKKLQNEYTRYSNRSEVIYNDRLDGRITVDEFDKLSTENRLHQEVIKNRIDNLQSADEDYYLSSECILNLVSRASELFESSEIEERRLFLKLTLQNLVLKGNKVQYCWQKPFDQIADSAYRPNWGG